MMRCFCLWQKRCTFGAMCAFGTLHVAHCTFEIALSGAIMLTLLLVCAFSPQVQKYLAWVCNMVPFRGIATAPQCGASQ